MLATIRRIAEIRPHPNADRLEIAHVQGYDCIVAKDAHAAGELIVFIEPDAVLPVAEWTAGVYGYTSKGRVKAAKLRGQWSMGLVMPKEILAGTGPLPDPVDGAEVAERLGIIKYEAPLPKDLKAKGALPFGIPKTDEERWQNLDSLPFGIEVDVTLKIDGSSFTAYCALPGIHAGAEPVVGVCSRSLDLKLDAEITNPWLEAARLTGVLDKLGAFCAAEGVSLALRGEVYGAGVQSMAVNPHCRRPRGVAFFSVWNIGARRYEDPAGPFGYKTLCAVLGLEAVPTIERAELTPELLTRYGDELESLDGEPFEGVVLKAGGWSCKVVNKWYDSKK